MRRVVWVALVVGLVSATLPTGVQYWHERRQREAAPDRQAQLQQEYDRLVSSGEVSMGRIVRLTPIEGWWRLSPWGRRADRLDVVIAYTDRDGHARQLEESWSAAFDHRYQVGDDIAVYAFEDNPVVKSASAHHLSVLAALERLSVAAPTTDGAAHPRP